MPVHPCSWKGKKGFQYGHQKCYVGRGAEAKAKKQEHAINISKARRAGHKIPKK